MENVLDISSLIHDLTDASIHLAIVSQSLDDFHLSKEVFVAQSRIHHVVLSLSDYFDLCHK